MGLYLVICICFEYYFVTEKIKMHHAIHTFLKRAKLFLNAWVLYACMCLCVCAYKYTYQTLY